MTYTCLLRATQSTHGGQDESLINVVGLTLAKGPGL
jgi:hypothetical protein